MAIARLNDGAESKDPENSYRTNDRVREFDQCSVPEKRISAKSCLVLDARISIGKIRKNSLGVSPDHHEVELLFAASFYFHGLNLPGILRQESVFQEGLFLRFLQRHCDVFAGADTA